MQTAFSDSRQSELENNIAAMVREGVSPYMALATLADLSGDQLTRVMGMPERRVMNIFRGVRDCPVIQVAQLCDMAGYSPDVLHPASLPDPAPANVTSAVTSWLLARPEMPVPVSAINFMKREMSKAEKLGALRIYERHPDNLEMLFRAQSVMKAHPVRHVDTYDFDWESTAPVNEIFADLNDAVKYTSSGAWIPGWQESWVISEKQQAYAFYRRRMFDAVCAMAPAEEPNLWLAAFNEKVEAIGFELTAEMVKAEPGIFYPIGRRNVADLSMVVDGRYISGQKVVDEFCHSYALGRKIAEWIALEERNHINRKDYIRTADHMADWYTHRLSKQFLQAEANARHIRGHFGIVDLTPQDDPEGMFSRQEAQPFGSVSVKTPMKMSVK